MHIPDPGRAQSAHVCLRSLGTVPPGLLHSMIEESWKRSQAYGLREDQRPDYDPIPTRELEDARERNRRLIVHARPVMASLYDQIIDTKSKIVLTDACGLILHSMGDGDFLPRGEELALQPGVMWSEESKGTNGMGTSLAARSPVLVHGFEHFLAANRMLTCSAVPIVDPFGETIGSLNVTGDHRHYNPHTMALVKMSVKMIENHLFAHGFEDGIALRFHSKPEFVGTLCEGIVAFAAAGNIVACNDSACKLLDVTMKEALKRSFGAIFELPFGAVIDHARLHPGLPILMGTRKGMTVTARVEVGERMLQAHPPRMHRTMGVQPHGTGWHGAARHEGSLAALLTGDPQIADAVAKVRKVLFHDIPILIQGETGTGKEMLARAIHDDGPRSGGAFVAVNCASIPDGLIESELFGYEEGAFTGARRKGQVGKIRQADGGTLFLDEIGDMPLHLQARLLRFLQERIVTPLGSLRAYSVKVAIVCATNRRLRDLVERSAFREDLYYRLNGFTVNLPALRNRADLPEVVARILRRECDQGVPAVAAEVLDVFLRHPWPGNLRQLANVLRAALVMCDGEEKVRMEHLPDDFIDDLRSPYDGCLNLRDAETALKPEPAVPPESLHSVELSAIRQALRRNAGNISAASRQLGVSRNTLYRKLKSL